ncbi:hypothetical protein TNCV_2948551 [Trichonephila clavipes]|nr:hypothetical protein TNCV_2948551 [Trichonephila clavipes]
MNITHIPWRRINSRENLIPDSERKSYSKRVATELQRIRNWVGIGYEYSESISKLSLKLSSSSNPTGSVIRVRDNNLKFPVNFIVPGEMDTILICWSVTLNSYFKGLPNRWDQLQLLAADEGSYVWKLVMFHALIIAGGDKLEWKCS